MSLLWLEGFDYYDIGVSGSNLSAAMLRRYATANVTSVFTSSIVTGRGGQGKALALHYINNFRTPALQASATGNTWIIGFAIKITSFNINIDTDILRIMDGSTERAALVLEDNALFVQGQSEFDHVLDVITIPNRWYYIELEINIHSTTGSYNLKVDGTSVKSQSGIDTASGADTSDGVEFVARGWSGEDWSLDDIYICNDSGAINNDFLGPIVVRSIFADGDGDNEDWTTSSGTDSYTLINETEPYDGDSDYIESSTTGNKSIFTFGNVVSGQTGIVGIKPWSTARVTDITSFTLKHTVKSNGVLYPQTGQGISNQSFAQYLDILETDPDTGVAWTESGLNAIQSGVEVG